MDKTKMILAILAAGAASGWSETDRPVLEKMSDAQLKGIHNGLTPPAGGQPATPAAPAAPAAPAQPTNNNQPAPAAPAAPAQTVTTNANQAAPMTEEQWLASAPQGVRELFLNGRDSLNREKGTLIETITKNAQNPFTKEELGNMPIGDLRKLARLAAVAQAPEASRFGVPDYSGMAPAPVGNVSGEIEPLALPTMNFDAKK